MEKNNIKDDINTIFTRENFIRLFKGTISELKLSSLKNKDAKVQPKLLESYIDLFNKEKITKQLVDNPEELYKTIFNAAGGHL